MCIKVYEMNRLKEKIKDHSKIIGTHLNFCDVGISRIAGLAGYDFIWIDLEHSYLSLDDLFAHILAIKSTGTPVIVRVPQDDLTYTKKVIEMGVDGIIFPMIRSAEQANKLIAATLYPPYGNRGFGPMGAVDFGFNDAKEYTHDTVDHLCRFIQIEHIDAVNDLEEIIKNEYIDGYIFGPNDLSGSINEICEVFEENTTELIKRAVSVLKKADKYIGLSTGDTSENVIKYWNSMGVDMISASSDFAILQAGFLENRKKLESVCKGVK
jgi:2-dehydro-3-deoxyglucarate aldolase/4-hydroxy-2-oxoheptanedioate aldolase